MSLASAVVPSSADASSLSLSLVEDYAAMNKEVDALLGVVLKGTTSSFAIPDIKSTALELKKSTERFVTHAKHIEEGLRRADGALRLRPPASSSYEAKKEDLVEEIAALRRELDAKNELLDTHAKSLLMWEGRLATMTGKNDLLAANFSLPSAAPVSESE